MAAELSSRIVLAGEIIEELSDLEESVKIILGPGLRSEANKVLATKCGLLRKKGNSTYWIDNHQKRVSERLFDTSSREMC